MTPEAPIAVHGASYRQILRSLSLTVPRGERLAIIGANGAGKTTLAKLLMAASSPDEGTVELFGMDTKTSGQRALRKLRSRIGVVFQGGHLVSRLSAFENVVIGCLGRTPRLASWLKRLPEQEIAFAEACLAKVGMEHKRHQRADTLSGGERQKIAIARALMQKADLLIADEPTSALDPKANREIIEMLARLADEQSMTLVTILHDINLLSLAATRIIGLAQGSIVLDDSLDRVNPTDIKKLYGGNGP